MNHGGRDAPLTPRPTVVFASYNSVFPTNSGERIRARNLISALRLMGFQVQAIVGNYDGANFREQDCDGVRFQEIPFAWPRLRQAAHIYFSPDAAFVEQVVAIHRVSPLSAIILDYGFMGAQIAPLARLGVPIILGTHNLESAITGQVRHSASPGQKLSTSLRQAIEFMHERRYFHRADAVLCVSEEDRRAYERFLPADRLYVVPNFIDVPDVYGSTIKEDRIILTGSFGNYQNIDGLRWFVANVWDDDLSTRTALCVAGKESDKAVKDLGNIKGVYGMGARDDLLSEIARSRCAIVPIRFAGGTRLKCLEAMAVRTPVVTTSKGGEGMDCSAFRIADTPASFKAAILDVLADPDGSEIAASKARALFDTSYSLAANVQALQKALEFAAVRAKSRHKTSSSLLSSPENQYG